MYLFSMCLLYLFSMCLRGGTEQRCVGEKVDRRTLRGRCCRKRRLALLLEYGVESCCSTLLFPPSL